MPDCHRIHLMFILLRGSMQAQLMGGEGGSADGGSWGFIHTHALRAKWIDICHELLQGFNR